MESQESNELAYTVTNGIGAIEESRNSSINVFKDKNKVSIKYYLIY